MFSAAIKGLQQLDRTAATKLFVYKTPAARHRNLSVNGVVWRFYLKTHCQLQTKIKLVIIFIF